MEWDIFLDLKKKLQDPRLSKGEQARLANALAYHASVLNKLFAQKGEDPRFTNVTLGDFLKDVRVFRLVRRDFKAWTRKLSSRK
jgi:hypothetical protein